MKAKLLLAIALSSVFSASAQVVPAAIGDSRLIDDEYRMPIPPLVDAQPFPTLTRSEERANYLRTSMTFEPAYIDNVIPYVGAEPQRDMSFTFRPAISFDQTGVRLHFDGIFEPDMVVYKTVTALNSFNPTAKLNAEYRVTRHTTFSFSDAFVRSNNVLDQPFAFQGQPTASGPTVSPTDVFLPFADRLTNTAGAELAYQPTRNTLIGAGGESTLFNYINPRQNSELNNSDSVAESAFYSTRLTGPQYIGLTYKDAKVIESTSGGDIALHIQDILPFYLLSLGKSLSVSVTIGPQRYEETFLSLTEAAAWTPTAMASVAWHSPGTNLLLSASRSITGGGGFLGEYETESGNAELRQRLTRSWSMQTSCGYILRKNAGETFLPGSDDQGHSLGAGFSVERKLQERITAQATYQRQHLSYAENAALGMHPDVDRVSVSISYQLKRSIGQ